MFFSFGGRIQFGLSAAAAVGLVAGVRVLSAFESNRNAADGAIIAPPLPEEIALTFDDGPNPRCTPRLVDMLSVRGVRATFFLVGHAAKAEPYLTRYIVDSGHMIGNHTWSHSLRTILSRGELREELYRTTNILEQITGKAVRYFRPPFGMRRLGVIAAARDLNMVPVLCNIRTADWGTPSADRTYRSLTTQIDAARRRGRAANVLLHDGGPAVLQPQRDAMLEATRRIVERYREVRRFVTIDNWRQRT